MRTKIHADVFISILLLTFCGAAASVAVKLKDGAEVLPLGLIAFMAAMAVIVLIGGIKKTVSGADNYPNSSSIKDSAKPVIVFCFIVAYGLLFHWLGFFVATFLFLVSLFMYLRAGSLKLIIPMTLVYEALVYVLFVKMLEVPLFRIGIFGHFFE